MKRLTAKQVKALRRKIDVIGYADIKVGTCRVVNNRRTTICRDKRGYFVTDSPSKRARTRGAVRSQRLSMYYQD